MLAAELPPASLDSPGPLLARVLLRAGVTPRHHSARTRLGAYGHFFSALVFFFFFF